MSTLLTIIIIILIIALVIWRGRPAVINILPIELFRKRLFSALIALVILLYLLSYLGSWPHFKL
jgi:hypothetical protein